MSFTERYCSVAGGGAHDGTTEADAWTLAEAITNYAAGHRINVKAGTYANTTTSRTLGTNGTTTSPVWWRGYNTTIGDIDTNNTLTKPAITFTTGQLAVSGNYHLVSNLDISGAQTTNGQLRLVTGSKIWIDRCRVECTSANSAGRAVSAAANSSAFTRCWFKSTSSADVVQSAGSPCTYAGCAFEGGANGILNSSSTITVVVFCVFNNTGGDAIRSTSAGNTWIVIGSTFYSVGSDGFETSVDPTTNQSVIIGNIFSESGGYGLNSSIGTNTANFVRLCNLFHANTSNPENGMGDWPSLSEQTDSSSPFTNAAGGDLSLVSTSNAKANGPPKAFENQTYTSYLDIGAVQRAEGAPAFSAFPGGQLLGL